MVSTVDCWSPVQLQVQIATYFWLTANPVMVLEISLKK